MPRTTRFSPQDFETMKSLYAQGQSTKQIAVQFKTDGGTIYHHLERMGTEFRTPSQSKKQYSIQETLLEQIDTEEKAYWLGFLFADGYVGSEQGTIALWLNEKDKDHVEAFGAFLQSTYPVRTDAKRTSCGISITSKKMHEDLIRWGCTPRKSLALRFPSFLPFSLHSHFIRGYFDGDGSAFLSKHGNKPNISFLGNYEFLEALENRVFFGTNINGNFYKHIRSEAYYLIYRGKFKAASIGEWLYHDAHFWLERKRAVVNQFPSPIDMRRRGNASTAGNVSQQTIHQYIEAQKGV